MAPPIRLGPFALGESIGAGGMARVWRATHPSGRTVAIKVMSPNVSDVATYADYFEREVAAVATLDHPNVVRVFDHGRVPPGPTDDPHLSPGLPWLAMEFCGGGTLRPMRGSVSWAVVRPYVQTLLAAVAHAHARGVVHRDIKPTNVLFASPARRPEDLRLADFGMAYAARAADPEGAPVGGSPSYGAPEQFLGFGPPDASADLYSIAVLVWALLTGNVPLRGTSLVETIRLRRAFELDPFEPVEAAPGGLRDWLAWLMDPDPDRRPADAAAALAALTDLDRAPDWCAPRLPDDWRTVGPASAPHWLHDVGRGLAGLRTPRPHGRDGLQDELWSELRAVVSEGRPRLAVLHGPRGSGRTRLATWLAERAGETGFDVVRLLGDVGAGDRAAAAAAELAGDRGAWLWLATAAESWAPAGAPPTRNLEVVALPDDVLVGAVVDQLGVAHSLAWSIAEAARGSVERAEQLLGHLLAQDLVVVGPVGFELRPGASLELPAEELGDVRGRFRRVLREDEWPLLELGAALGPRPEYELWAELCRRRGLALGVGPLHRVLRAGLLRPVAGSLAFAEGRVVDALAEHAAEHGRWRAQRGAAADLLLERRPRHDVERAAALLDAGRADEAIAALQPTLAGGVMVPMSRYRRAAQLLRRAGGDRGAELTPWLDFAQLRIDEADGRDAAALGQRADAIVEASAQVPSVQCSALRAAARFHRRVGTVGRSERDVLLRALQVAHGGTRADRVTTLYSLGFAAMAADDPEAAVAWFDRGVAQAVSGGDPAQIALCRYGRAHPLYGTGRCDEAQAELDEALALVEPMGWPTFRQRIRSSMLECAVADERYGDAAVIGREVVAAARRERNLFALVPRLLNLALALAELGELDEAERHVREAQAAHAGARPAHRAVAAIVLGYLMNRRGRWRDAEDHLVRAEAELPPDKAGLLRTQVLLQRCWSLAERHDGPAWDAAFDELVAATGSRSWSLRMAERTACRMAQAWAEAGDPDRSARAERWRQTLEA